MGYTDNDVRRYIGNDIAKFKNKNEFKLYLINFSNDDLSLKQRIIKAEANNVNIVYQENNILIIAIANFKQSNCMGTRKWCISYDKNHFIKYQDYQQYFAFNYNYEITDKRSMVGLSLSKKDLSVVCAYYKDNTEMYDLSEKIEYKKIIFPSDNYII